MLVTGRTYQQSTKPTITTRRRDNVIHNGTLDAWKNLDTTVEPTEYQEGKEKVKSNIVHYANLTHEFGSY